MITRYFEVLKIYPCFLAGFKFLFAFFLSPHFVLFVNPFYCLLCLSPYLVLFANPFCFVCQPILFCLSVQNFVCLLCLLLNFGLFVNRLCFVSSKFCLLLLFVSPFGRSGGCLIPIKRLTLLKSVLYSHFKGLRNLVKSPHVVN